MPEFEQLLADMELQMSIIKEVSVEMQKRFPDQNPAVVERNLYQAAYMEGIKELRKAIAFIKKDCREFTVEEDEMKEAV
jgi:hypothetical protein